VEIPYPIAALFEVRKCLAVLIKLKPDTFGSLFEGNKTAHEREEKATGLTILIYIHDKT
jgi:hypothetical protein